MGFNATAPRGCRSAAARTRVRQLKVSRTWHPPPLLDTIGQARLVLKGRANLRRVVASQIAR